MVGKRIALPAAALAAALIAAAPAAAAPEDGRPVRVQLLGIDDFHGHLEATTPGRVSRTKDPRDAVPAGGIEYLATHIRMLGRRHEHTLVVAAGDLVGASPLLSSLFHDEPAIQAMNGIGLDVSAVGNHEFDEGLSELRRLQRGGCHPRDGCADGTPFTGARFPFLAANVIRAGTRKTIFPPYAIRRVGGERIGFIGMTLEGTSALISPATAAKLRFRDEAETANRYARRLKRRGVRAIVVLLHEGDYVSRPDTVDSCPGIYGPLASIVRRTTRQVDVFLTGHTHAAYNCVIDHRHVTAAGSYGRLITRVDLRISRRTHDVVGVRTDNWIVGQDVMRAPDMTALIEHYRRFAAPLEDRVIGRLAASASRTLDPSGESRMGNLVADARRGATGADVALVLHGGVRAGLAAGTVTYGRAFQAQPFGTRLVTVTLTGRQVLDLLKRQWCERESPEVLYASGITYAWSAGIAAQVAGRRCATATTPVGSLRIGGSPVSTATPYRVTVDSGMASGRHGLSELAAGAQRTGGVSDIAALEAHLKPSLAGAPLPPPARDRIARVP